MPARPPPANLRVQEAVERRCCEAFAAVRHFEKTHCLALQNMGYTYLQRRAALVQRFLELAERCARWQGMGPRWRGVGVGLARCGCAWACTAWRGVPAEGRRRYGRG